MQPAHRLETLVGSVSVAGEGTHPVQYQARRGLSLWGWGRCPLWSVLRTLRWCFCSDSCLRGLHQEAGPASALAISHRLKPLSNVLALPLLFTFVLAQ